MTQFEPSYYNVSSVMMSAMIGMNSGLVFPQSNFVSGGMASSTSTAASNLLSSSTTESFYYTTLGRNSISLGGGGGGGADDQNDYIINGGGGGASGVTESTTISNFISKNDGFDYGSGGGGGGMSLERNNGLFPPNRTEFVIGDLPEEFRVVEETAWPRIYAYFIVFIISAIANFCELVWVCRRLRTRASPVNRLFLHLCIADLIVVFMVAAVEVLWRISIGWYAGNFMCKFVMFSRAFGLYLSSLMIVCISLDRYYAVVYPLRVVDASRRVKIMLASAWITAAACAVPQSIVFREESHPYFPAFRQCSTLWWPGIERANTWFSVTIMYFFPLGVIIFAYGSIVIKIAGYLRESGGDGTNFLRRNGMPVFQRAKLRTLKLTFTVIIIFVICYGPYCFISVWYLIDEQSATSLDGNVQDALFIWAVANSMANPLVYGFNESCKKRKDQPQETYKEPDQRSEAVIMRNYSSRYTNKTRVRFSTQHSPQASAAV